MQMDQEIMALDGKTMRRTLERANVQGPMHVVSAWAARNALVLAHGKVDAKSNESTALPALLSPLDHRSVACGRG